MSIGADDALRDWAREMAQIRRPCPWCGRQLRPCNYARHVGARHFRQLTIDDMRIEDQRARATSGADHSAP